MFSPRVGVKFIRRLSAGSLGTTGSTTTCWSSMSGPPWSTLSTIYPSVVSRNSMMVRDEGCRSTIPCHPSSAALSNSVSSSSAARQEALASASRTENEMCHTPLRVGMAQPDVWTEVL